MFLDICVGMFLMVSIDNNNINPVCEHSFLHCKRYRRLFDGDETPTDWSKHSKKPFTIGLHYFTENSWLVNFISTLQGYFTNRAKADRYLLTTTNAISDIHVKYLYNYRDRFSRVNILIRSTRLPRTIDLHPVYADLLPLKPVKAL